MPNLINYSEGTSMAEESSSSMNFGDNPLLWLITLGFLKGDNLLGGNGGAAAAGGLAAVNGAKIDCLTQGQTYLADTLARQANDFDYQNLVNNINAQANIGRDIQDTIFRETAAIERSLAACCCRNEAAAVQTQNAISQQTTALIMNQNQNTQSILDSLCQDRIATLQAQNNNLQSQLNIAETVKQITQACGCCGGSATVSSSQ